MWWWRCRGSWFWWCAVVPMLRYIDCRLNSYMKAWIISEWYCIFNASALINEWSVCNISFFIKWFCWLFGSVLQEFLILRVSIFLLLSLLIDVYNCFLWKSVTLFLLYSSFFIEQLVAWPLSFLGIQVLRRFISAGNKIKYIPVEIKWREEYCKIGSWQNGYR